MVAVETPIRSSFGDIQGNVAIGHNNQQFVLNVGSISAGGGGTLHIAGPGQAVKPRPRPEVCDLRPRPSTCFLGRVAETQRIKSQLNDNFVVELFGKNGWGKSSLLRHVGNLSDLDTRHGIVSLSATSKGRDDVLQLLFNAFYECDIPYKPDQAELRHLLGCQKAIVLLDDVELDRDGIEHILDVARDCRFIITGAQPRALAGDEIKLKGLTGPYAFMLLEKRLRRKLTESERPIARMLHELVQGQPLRLVQLATAARENDVSLDELNAVRSIQDFDQFVGTGVTALSTSKKKFLSILALIPGLRLSAAQLSAMSKESVTQKELASLADDGFLAEHLSEGAGEPIRFSLRRNLVKSVLAAAAVGVTTTVLLNYFRAWLETNSSNPELLKSEMGTLQEVLRFAAENQYWQDVLNIGQVIEPIQALNVVWDSWQQTLEFCLEAASNLNSPDAHAWALHEMGNRAMCLGDAETAEACWTEALRIRESTPGCTGIEATQQNLGLISNVLPSAAVATSSILMPILHGLIVAAIVIALAIGLVQFSPMVAGWFQSPLAVNYSLKLSQTDIVGGQPISITVSADQPIETTDVQLEVNNRDGDVAFFELNGQRKHLASIRLDEGKDETVIVLKTDPVEKPTVAKIRLRTAGSPEVEETVRLSPFAELAELEIRPLRLLGGGVAQGVVRLKEPTPRDLTVTLAANSDRLEVPDSVRIPAGLQEFSFHIEAPVQENGGLVEVAASFGETQLKKPIAIDAAVLVPNLVEKTVAEAEGILENKGLKIGLADRMPPTARVRWQQPYAHSENTPSVVQPGQVVQVSAAVTVPSVLEMSFAEATRRLAKHGVKIKGPNGANGRETVDRQQPVAGTVLDQEPYLVNVDLKVQVPDLRRSKIQQAVDQLRELNLNPAIPLPDKYSRKPMRMRNFAGSSI